MSGFLKKTVLVFYLFAATASAQVWLGRSEIGYTVGGMNYIGDLNDQTMFDKVNLAMGGFYRLNFDERWSLRVDIDYGHVEGGNPDYIKRRNLSFRSYIFEGSLRAEFNFFPFSLRDDHFFWTPYLFGGIGFFSFNPKAYYTDPVTGESQWYELQPLGTEGQGTALAPDRPTYTLKQISMPFGVGVKYHPSKSLTLSAEYGFRKTWTDYIDDVSTTYVDNSQLAYIHGNVAAALADRSGEVEPGYVNAAGIKRGDDSLDDWFAYFNVSVSLKLDYIFGWMLKKKCDNK
ncbi:MAG: outer membrane beta-barrel protein [Bacteroidales bacterium]|nr:outer membrane beta-barrel protein [Bacteroidales bacterium]